MSIDNLLTRAWAIRSILTRLYPAYDKWGTLYVRCYTCGRIMRVFDSYTHAGHCFGGRGNSILLDPDGLRPQCHICNTGTDRKTQLFKDKLREEIGEERFFALYRRHSTAKKYMEEELTQEIEKSVNELQELIESREWWGMISAHAMKLLGRITAKGGMR